MAPAAGGGNFLTDKIGPLPGWGWAAVAGGGFLLWRWWQNRQAASSSSPTSMTVAASPAATEPSAQLTTPGGFSYSGPLSGLQYAIPQGAMSATAAPSAAAAAASPTIGSMLGSALPSSTAVSPVPLGSTEVSLLQSGTPLYFQPSPGAGYYPAAEFTGPGTGPGGTGYNTFVAGGTPLYVANP